MRLRNIIILLAILLALGGVYYYTTLPPTEGPPPSLRIQLWNIETEDITRIEISLPREGLKQAFLRESDGSWRFDDAGKFPVDANRWGGITQLLSGPQAERLVAENAAETRLASFGLTPPAMELAIDTADGKTTLIFVGDAVPDGHAYYVQIPGTGNIATIDRSWYEVLARLAREPPYTTSAPK